MIQGLRPYPAVKDSGVHLLGFVPAHWDVRPLKHWLGINETVLPDDTDPDYFLEYLDVGSVGTGHLVASPEQMSFDSAPSRARRIVSEGDTLVSTVRTYLKAVWHAEQAKAGLIASTGFAVLTPRCGTWSKFVSYVCQSQPFADGVMANSIGVAYPAIAETRLGSLAIAIPPLEEQASIARFLDHATSRIDRYIRAKENLLVLLEEQKQTVIEEAITYDTRRKGLSWQRVRADLPDHAAKRREVRLRSVINAIQIGPFGSQLHASDYAEGGTPVINPSHIGNGRILPDPSVTVDPLKEEELSIHLLRVDDVVMARRGELGRCALVGVREEGWICGTGSLRIRPNVTVILPAFLALCLTCRSVREALAAGSIGATMNNLNATTVSRLRIPFPGLDDQAAIVDYLADATARLDEASNGVRNQVLAMGEYRQRLIADVVTGKVDVRQAAVDLDERPFTDGIGASKDGAVQNSRGPHGGIATEATS